MPPPDKMERVEALISALPTMKADALIEAARAADPALADMIEVCRRQADAARRARFFAILTPLSADPATSPPSLSHAPPAVLDRLWRWAVEELAPEAGAVDRDDGRLNAARIALADAVQARLDAAGNDPRKARRLGRRLGVSDFGVIRDIIVVLKTAPALERALAGLPLGLEAVGPKLADDIAARFAALDDSADREGAIWFLHLVMARLERPWTILRVFEKLSGRKDDFLVSRTQTALVGEALLEDASFFIDSFSVPPLTADDADRAASAMAAFAAATTGMTREIGIRKDGEWGRRLLSLRAQAAERMEQHHARALQLMEAVLPDPYRPRVRRWRLSETERADAFNRLAALCRFLTLTQDDAARAAAAGAHRETLAALAGRCEAAGGALLEALRRGQAPDEADAEMQRVAALTVVLGDQAGADILLRRWAAASAA